MKIPPSLCGIRVIRGQKNSHELHEKTMTKAIFIRSGEPQDHGNLVVGVETELATKTIVFVKSVKSVG